MPDTTRLANQLNQNDPQSLTNGDLSIQNLSELGTHRSLKSQTSLDLELSPSSSSNGSDTLLRSPNSPLGEVAVAQPLQGSVSLLQQETLNTILPQNNQQIVADSFALADNIVVEQNVMVFESAEPYELLIGPDEQRWNTGGPLGSGVTVQYNFTGDFRFNESQRNNIRAALDAVSFSTQLQFKEVGVNDPVRLSFGITNSGIFDEFADVHYTPEMSLTLGGLLEWDWSEHIPEKAITFRPDDALDLDNDDMLSNSTPGSYGFQQLVRGIARASGLYRFSGEYPDHQINTQYSILAGGYHPGMEYPDGKNTQESFAKTTMMHDLAALQHLYGRAPLAGAGNNIYIWETNQTFVETIYDSFGIDTIDISNFTYDATINLNPGSFSSIGPAAPGSANSATNNLGIAYSPDSDFNTIIENVVGGLGDDAVTGNTADNHIRTGQGHDIATGGAGEDTIEGGDGNDILHGNLNADTIKGGDGEDNIWGGEGDDRLEGGDHKDNLTGGNGGDNIYGDGGNDDLKGEAGDDNLSGGEGDDTIHGGQGDDHMRGQGGYDTLFEEADVNFTLTYTHLAASNGYGTDEIEGFEFVHLVGGRSANTFYATQFNESVLFVGKDGNDILFGGAYDDTLAGVDHNDILNGFIGDDYLLGGQGDDDLDGGDGQDTLFGGDDNDRLNGNAENDELYGNDGDDELNGNEGNDTLSGGQGDDELNGGTGIDWIFESGDTDFHLNNLNLFQMGPDGGVDTHSNVEYVQIKGGESDNVLDALIYNQGRVRFYGNGGNDNIIGGAHGDSLYGGQDDDNIQGVFGDDTLFGDEGNDIISGGVGDDIISGGDGIDTLLESSNNVDFVLTDGNLDGTGHDILGSVEQAILSSGLGDNTIHATFFSGDVTLDGGEGNDNLFGSLHGSDLLKGGEDDDQLYGHGGNDSLNGGDGNNLLAGGFGDDVLKSGEDDDQLYGGKGNDSLDGGEGDNILSGGDGDDRYYLGKDAVNTEIYDSSGQDTLDFALNLNPITLDLLLNDTQEIQVGKTLRLNPGTEIENVQGSSEADTIFGNQANNYLIGNFGDDSLHGREGEDHLVGAFGNDQLTGGIGGDIFELAANAGIDTIMDFESGSDHLYLTNGFSELDTSVSGLINPNEFATVASDVEVENSSAFLVYSLGTGNLFYNPNGAENGFGLGGSQFATLSGIPTLEATDIYL